MYTKLLKRTPSRFLNVIHEYANLELILELVSRHADRSRRHPGHAPKMVHGNPGHAPKMVYQSGASMVVFWRI